MSLTRQLGVSLRPALRLDRAFAPSTLRVPTRAFTTSHTVYRQVRQQKAFDTEGRSNAMSRGGSRGGARQGSLGGYVNRKPKEVVQPPPALKLRPESLPSLIIERLDEWSASDRVSERLETYGFNAAEARETLDEWVARAKDDLEACAAGENFITRMNEIGWDANSLVLAYESGTFGEVFEAAFTRHFIEYAAAAGPEDLRLHLSALLRTTDISNFAGQYEKARSIKRAFHLHMGPTNSGKTYNALKALSRAKTGVYAGPLRLLAHEVWERINLGSVGDLNGVGRPCNLLTGEERRVVARDAGIVSCTIEMLPFGGAPGGDPWEVVVIDEIQMLADSQRGGGWTTAVFGANAKEIHMCGDETTAALLKTMIDGFNGDTLTIHRYDRLTPLAVAEESLEGDWNKVQPGDCIVTFSRTNVFGVKKMVESTLGKKCAVVYGALPPETRAEQARDFNEETGRSEILVASDAVGMGLNLKIGRIIFESLSKYDGKNEVPLSLSQVKQIAGRAGRFGMQRSDTTTDEESVPGGMVTTLHKADLPLLRAMLPLPLPPVTRAVVNVPASSIVDFAPLLPNDTSFGDIITHFTALAKLPPNTVLAEQYKRMPISDVIEPYRNTLTLAEAEMLCVAPVNLRDERVAGMFARIVESYAKDFYVDLDEVLEPSSLLRTLKTVEETLAALPPLPPHLGVFRAPLAPPITIAAIPLLESLHKTLVLYIWLSYRLEIAMPDRERAVAYKTRTEKVLEICLERLPGVRPKKKGERTKDADREVALYRRKYVDKHGLVKPSFSWVRNEVSARESRKQRWSGLAVAEDRDNDRAPSR